MLGSRSVGVGSTLAFPSMGEMREMDRTSFESTSRQALSDPNIL